MICMLQTITSLDSQILFWIQQNIRSDSATLFWEFMTDLGNIGILWIFVTLILLFRKKTRTAGITAALAILMDTVISNGILKTWIARPRPFLTYTDIMPIIPPPTDFSFPSGHTAIAFAVAFVIYELLPRRYSIPALVTAALIGMSRLYLGVHYPTDILAGILIGFAIAKTAVWLIQKMGSHHWLST